MTTLIIESTYDADGNLIEELTSNIQEAFDFVEVDYCESFYGDFVLDANDFTNGISLCDVPNPYVQGTSVACDQLELGQEYELQIISLGGKLHRTQQVRGGDAIQIRGLPATGMYFLNWRRENGERWAQKVIVF